MTPDYDMRSQCYQLAKDYLESEYFAQRQNVMEKWQAEIGSNKDFATPAFNQIGGYNMKTKYNVPPLEVAPYPSVDQILELTDRLISKFKNK